VSKRVQIWAGCLSLAGLLLYTFWHTGGLLSRYVAPGFIGYVAAMGVEAAIVSLSLRIGSLRKSGQSPVFFLFVLVSVVVVSAGANIAEGFAASQGELLTSETVAELDWLQAGLGAAATGLVSLIVLAMSEIVGTDVESQARAARRERAKAEAEPAVSEPEQVVKRCPVAGCGREFATVQALNAHMRTHKQNGAENGSGDD